MIPIHEDWREGRILGVKELIHTALIYADEAFSFYYSFSSSLL